MDEDRIVADMLKKKLKKSAKVSKLVEEVKDMLSAIQRAAQDSCSLLTDWTSPEAKYVGCRCRVYWDGDKEWFEARIVNYDSLTKKHFLYYDMDDTAEWVDLLQEDVCIGTELVLAKFGAGMWPALKYFVSPTAISRLPFKFDPAVAEYVAFLDESGGGHFAKISKKNIEPFVDRVANGSRVSAASSKMVKAFEMARAEMEARTNCVDVSNLLMCVVCTVLDL